MQFSLALIAAGSLLKLLIIPLGGLAFLLFLLVLGAFGLFVSLGLISALSWVFRRLTGRRPRSRSVWPN